MACFGAEAGTKADAMSLTGLFIHTGIMAREFCPLLDRRLQWSTTQRRSLHHVHKLYHVLEQHQETRKPSVNPPETNCRTTGLTGNLKSSRCHTV